MRYKLITKHPVALDSPDHIEPRGTARDNSVNLKFNDKLRRLFTGYKASVLDFGCAGGGMVKSLINEGHISIGLEGSDHNKVNKLHEWATIPDNLFTCDVTKPFVLHTGDKQPYKFDVITAWEFLEHPKEKDLPMVFTNMLEHLKDGGLVIGSICQSKSIWDKLEHHQTRKPWEWWEQVFNNFGFTRRHDFEAVIGKDWVRSVHFNFVMQQGVYLNPTAAERLDAVSV